MSVTCPRLMVLSGHSPPVLKHDCCDLTELLLTVLKDMHADWTFEKLTGSCNMFLETVALLLYLLTWSVSDKCRKNTKSEHKYMDVDNADSRDTWYSTRQVQDSPFFSGTHESLKFYEILFVTSSTHQNFENVFLDSQD